MKRILLILMILLPVFSYGQTPLPIGSKNGWSHAIGLWENDTAINMTIIDTAATKLAYPSHLEGRIGSAGGRIWQYRGGSFKLFDSVTIDQSTIIHWTDTISGGLIATKKNVSDSAAALRGVLNTKEPAISAGTNSQYWRGDKTWQPLDKSAVGLSNVDNTSDLNKPVSTAQQAAINAVTPLNSVSARVSLPYTKAINTVGDIRLSDSGDITLTPDFNNPQAGATASIVITGDGVHNIYAPSYIIPEGSNFKNSTIHKYLFKSTYDGTRYYGEFTRLFDTINCPGFLPPVTGMFYSFIGDSWTAGQGVANPYPVKFAALAGGTAINNGVSGMAMQKTTAWPNYFNPSSIASDYDSIAYTFIALGINDYLRYSSGTFGFSSYGYLDAYTTALDTAFSPPRNQKRKKLVLIAPFYVPAVTVPLDTQFRYVQIARSLAKSYGVPLIDLWTKMRDLPGINTMFQGDNLHPNQALQDSIGTWIFNSDFRTETQKLCTESGMPALNKANASQQGLTDSTQKAMERIRVQENTAVHYTSDTVGAVANIDIRSKGGTPLDFRINGAFVARVNSALQWLFGKSTSSSPRLKAEFSNSISTDSFNLSRYWGLLRTDLPTTTSITAYSTGGFYTSNYMNATALRTGIGGAGAWYLWLNSTKWFRTYDESYGWDRNQPTASDTVGPGDGSYTMTANKSYFLTATRPISPNQSPLEVYVSYDNSGNPLLKYKRPSNLIVPTIVNKKVVLTCPSGQINYTVKPSAPNSANGFFPAESYFMLRDTAGNRSGVGSLVTMNNITGQIVAGSVDSAANNSMIDAISTTKGSSPIPRMTKAQRNAIAGPTIGLKAIVTDGGYESMHNGINWMGDIVTSSAATLTLTYGTHYVNTGAATTWTLPAVSSSVVSFGNAITIKNRGSGDITLNSNAGSTIYSTSAVSTITITAGASVLLMPDGTFFNVE